MAYGMRRYRRGRRFSRGLHGQIMHRPSWRGRIARRASRRVYRRSLRMPKRLLAKTYANTVGQIAYRSGGRISHRRYGRRY